MLLKHDLLVSIIVPCYKQARYLPEALDSLINQTYTNWECIIVNDGSPDDTETIALNYCKADLRFKYIFQENSGLSFARNSGLKAAKGELIQFLDSDDILLPSKLYEQVKLFGEIKDIDICVSYYKLFTSNPLKAFDTAISLKPYNCTLNGFLFSWNTGFVFPPVCYLVKKDFLNRNSIFFNENIAAFEDWIFLIQLCLKGANFCVLDKTLAFYRRHDSNMTNDYHFMSKNIIKAVFIVYELLPSGMKKNFIDNIDPFISLTLRDILGVDSLYLRANSVEFKIGKASLCPLRFFYQLTLRAKRKLKRLL